MIQTKSWNRSKARKKRKARRARKMRKMRKARKARTARRKEIEKKITEMISESPPD